MTRERWQQVEAVLQAALDRPADQRSAFLDEACAGDPALRREVESLLAMWELSDPLMEKPAAEAAAALLRHEPDDTMVGRRIGPYQIQREIGHGGMGAVYLAVRADDAYQKQVAIKLVRPGMATDAIVRRFRHERQILATLDHPNIARLLDGGTTDDGLSYFVMDYVEGRPIDRYCDEHQLSIRARLELFRTACSAVQYAHEHQVVHRDLKPSNILVTDQGVVKLLDFGIAKVLDPERTGPTAESTILGLRPMTPEYASPEQVRGGPVTAASDIYSLGVLLYELLTGHRPYHLQAHTPQEVEHIVCEKEPEKPSTAIGRVEAAPSADGATPIARTPESVSATRADSPERLRRRLAGDLDNIVLMALRKAPERRYASVEQFSEDIGRYLQDLPVLARKETLAYRTAKFIHRNKVAVSEAAVIVLLLLILIGLGVYLVPRRGPVMEKTIQSLAVLPLQNLSGDPAEDYFADGMTEALINDLAQIAVLRVVSRTSAMQYKGVRRPLPEVAQALHVDAVVEGSVQRAGERVRIAVQLIQAATDQPLWAKSYERDRGDVLALQSEVAQAIAREIRVTLTPQEKTRLATVRPTHREAYNAYIKGCYHLENQHYTEESLKRSAEYFQQALQKDPQYAPAYAGLAQCYNLLSNGGFLAPQEFFPKAKVAAAKALQLDDQLAEAHTALGQVKMFYEWDFVGAERAYRRAIELNPGSARAHSLYGQLLTASERREAAVAELKRAVELDPLSLGMNSRLAWTFYCMGQYDEAIEQARKVTDMDPNYWLGHRSLGQAYEQKGMHEEATAEFQKSIDHSGSSTALAGLGYVYAVSGKRKQAEEVMGQLQELSRHRYVSPLSVAHIYAGLGDRDQAFSWLNKASEDHAQGLIWIKVDPRWRNLRADPRFAELVRRVGLPP